MSKYSFFWRSQHQLFYMQGNLASYTRYRHIPFNAIDDVLQISHESEQSCYLGVADWARQVEEGRMFLDREQAKQYIADAKKQCQAHRDFFQEIVELDVSLATSDVLCTYWEGLIDYYAHTIAYFRSTQDEPSRLIVARVTEALLPDQAEALMLSSELDEINKEEIAWQKIVDTGLTHEKALEHVAHFPWLFQNSLEYTDTVRELEERLRGHVPHDTVGEKEKLRQQQVTILAQRPELIDDVDTLHELALLRPEVKSCWAATGYYAKKLLDEIAKRFEVDLHTLTFFYLDEDVSLLLRTRKVLSEQEIADRREGVLYILQPEGTFRRVIGTEATRIAKELLASDDDNVTELRGAGAQKGRVTGKVWILQSNDAVAAQKFREEFRDEILVTGMTQPNVVDIARKAKAIITDEGGMLCHAAIISREFGTPCIVGTKNATKVLRDGDLVEVDADNGVVTILERASRTV